MTADRMSCRTDRDGEARPLRGILIHVIEETTRHAGQTGHFHAEGDDR